LISSSKGMSGSTGLKFGFLGIFLNSDFMSTCNRGEALLEMRPYRVFCNLRLH
jgi:hypothetical protein